MDPEDQLLVPLQSSSLLSKAKKNTQVRHIGLVDGIALVLGIQIGSGLFSSPSLVVRNTGSEPAALLIWILAGLLAWTCAAGYIELGIRVPHNGGPQEYLSYCFNNTLGFVASWTTIFVVKPCSTAMLSLVIADYICNALSPVWAASEDFKHPLALVIVTTVAAINCFSNRASDATTKVALTCKIIGVSTIILVGFGSLFSQGGFPKSSSDNKKLPTSRPLSNYTDATLSAMWAYSGWETLSFVGGELKNPYRNISLVINSSMTIVLLLSCLVNVAYFAVLPITDIVSSNTIALTFSERAFGHSGAALYTTMVCLSTFGTMNGKIFTAGRLTQAAAQRKYLPAVLRKLKDPKPVKHVKTSLLERDEESSTAAKEGFVPVRAIVFNTAIAAVYILFGNFEPLVLFIGVAECSVAFTALLGLMWLRLRRPSPEDDRDHDRDHDHHSSLSSSSRSPSPHLPVHFQAPAPFIVLALVATGVMVTVSVAKHPASLLGLAVFAILSAALHHFVIEK